MLITNITKIYNVLDDHTNITMHNKYINFNNFNLLYDSYFINKQIKLNNNEIKNIIDNSFTQSNFIDYIYIAYHCIDYINKYIINKITENAFVIGVFVSENSPLSKKHISDDCSGFIKLFNLIFIYKENKLVLDLIQINGKLITEKIYLQLNNNFNIESNENTNVCSDNECPICLSNNGNMIETPCKHQFHEKCLSLVNTLKCPICRYDLYEYYLKNGINKTELDNKLLKHKTELQLIKHCEFINSMDITTLTQTQLLYLSLECLKLNNGYVDNYIEIIIMMIKNVSKLFFDINKIKSKKNNGLFLYNYDNITDFIIQQSNQYSDSNAIWFTLRKIKQKSLIQFYNKYKTETNFIVCVNIENVNKCVCIEEYDYKKTSRIKYNDILKILTTCNIPLINSTNDFVYNREYKYASYILSHFR